LLVCRLIISFWCEQQSSHHICLTIIVLILTLTIRFTTLLQIQWPSLHSSSSRSTTITSLLWGHTLDLCPSWLHL
jgi:hypothetical protein